MDQKLKPKYHHLLRKNDFYFLLSQYVGLQDLINQELNGRGDNVEGDLRKKLISKGIANPIIYGSNIVPMTKLIADRQRQINPEADDEVRAYLIRHGNHPSCYQRKDPLPKARPNLKPLLLSKSLHHAKGKNLVAQSDDGESKKINEILPITLQERILNRLAGKDPDSADEVNDFLTRNGGVIVAPFYQPGTRGG